MNPALFLHWGPGFHAEVEKNWFGSSLPIHWWTQPTLQENEPRGLERLIQSALAQLELLTREKPVHLLAHSFGGQIAHELAALRPDLVSGITFLGSGFYTPDGFAGLARTILASELSRAPELSSALREFDLDRKEAARFWGLISQIVSVQGFDRLYWARDSEEAYRRYTGICASLPPLHMPTFLGAMNDYFGRAPLLLRAEPSPFRGPVRFLQGKADPLTGADDAALWRKVFPQLEAKVGLNCGHFVHFELPPEIWLPSGA